MHLVEQADQMPTGMLLHEARKQFTMAELVRYGWQQALYQRGGWFLLMVWAERTCGVRATSSASAGSVTARSASTAPTPNGDSQ